MTILRVLIFSACVGAAVCQAEQLSLVAAKDTTIFENRDNFSNGSGRYLFSGATASRNQGLVRRALLAFDLSEIPAGATITDASLRLSVSKVPPAAANAEMALHRLLQDFGEGSSDAPGNEGQGTTAANGDATWASAILGTADWSNVGGDFVAEPSSTVSVSGRGNYTWPSTDQLIGDVQHWLDDPAQNFGWILIGDETTVKSAKRFDSRSSTSASNRPTLTIDFVMSTLVGDFNADGILNPDDIDLLCGALGSGDPNTFDVTGDGAVNNDDLTVWVTDLAGTFFGDTDLNGSVTFADFLALSANFGQGNRWSQGDFDCSGSVAFADFLALSANFGKAAQAASPASVPEPAGTVLLLVALLCSGRAWRKPSGNRQRRRV